MGKVIWKLFLAWDFDKEEQWLNEMSTQGLALTATEYRKYTFEDTAPGAYQIRMEYLKHGVHHPESQQYLKFLEDAGGEYLGHLGKWVYFRGKQDFELYSDDISRIKYLHRILVFLISFAAVQLLNCIVPILNLIKSPTNILAIAAVAFTGAVTLSCLWSVVKVLRKRRALKQRQQLYEG